MHPVLMIAVSVMVPVTCLGLVMWLSWLEDTLGDSVKRSQRRHAPEPVRGVAAPPAEPAPTPVAAAPAAATPATAADTEPAVATAESDVPADPTPQPSVAPAT